MPLFFYVINEHMIMPEWFGHKYIFYELMLGNLILSATSNLIMICLS